MFRPAVAIFRFPQTIKMSLYNLCGDVLMKRSLCISPLFVLVSSVNRLYISRTVKTQPHSPGLFRFSLNNVTSLSVMTNFSDHRFDKLFFCLGRCN